MSLLLAKNIWANIAQMVISTALILVLYKFISSRLGVAELGVWSVIMASVSLARLSEFGLSASVTRFVALCSASGNSHEQILELIGTATITLMVAIALLIPIFYFSLLSIIPYIFPENYQNIAEDILPYALLSFWMSAISGVLFSTLDGLQLMVIRSYIFIFGQGFFTITGILLAYHYGILGLAYAQVGQGILLIVASYFMVCRIFQNYSIFQYKFSNAILRKMLGYGFNVQASTLFMSMLDPISKALIIKFGGAESAGYFEIANQIVSRVRALITSANQAVIPYVASTNFRSIGALSSFYIKNIKIVAYISLPLLGGLVLWSHAISSFILGAPNIEFFYMFMIIAAGWMVNLISSPAYFINQGTGEVRLNTIAIGIMSALNIFLGLLFGYFFGALGVVWAYAIAIAVGSVFLLRNKIYAYGHQFSLRFRGYGLLSCAHIGAILVGSLFWITPENIFSNYLFFSLSNLLLIYSAYRHPLYIQFIEQISKGIRRAN